MNSKAKTWVRSQGDITALAKKLGVSRASVYNWLKDKKSPGPGNAMALVDLAGGELAMSDIFPELFAYGKEPTHD